MASKKSSALKNLSKNTKALKRESQQLSKNLASSVSATARTIKTIKKAVSKVTAKKSVPAKVSSKQGSAPAAKPQSKKQATKTRASKSSPGDEQRKIERLLGEEFDSLAEARRAFKAQTQPVSQSTVNRYKRKQRQNITARAGKSSYTLTELASSKSNKLATLFADLEKNAAEIDKLKSPGQRWAFKIYDRRSLDVRRTMKEVVGFLANSGGLENDHNPYLYQQISFLTIGEPAREYREQRIEEQKELQKSNRRVASATRKEVGGRKPMGYTTVSNPKGMRNKTKIEMMGDLLSKLQTERKAHAAEAKANAASQRQLQKALLAERKANAATQKKFQREMEKQRKLLARLLGGGKLSSTKAKPSAKRVGKGTSVGSGASKRVSKPVKASKKSSVKKPAKKSSPKKVAKLKRKK